MKFLFCLVFIGIICCQSVVFGTNNSTTGLSGILSALKSGGVINTAIKDVKLFKAASSIFANIMGVSPLGREVLNEASKKSPFTRVLMKIVGGHIPDLKDLYQLGTYRKIKQNGSAIAVLANNKQWQQLVALMRKADFSTSSTDMEESIRLLTGRHIDLQSSMLRDPKTGKLLITGAAEYRNLIEFFVFLHDNWNWIMVLTTPYNFLEIIQVIEVMDYTHLAQIKALSLGNYGNKYSVSASVDPDVAHVLQLVKSGQSVLKQRDAVKAEPMAVEFFISMSNVFARVVRETDSSSKTLVG